MDKDEHRRMFSRSSVGFSVSVSCEDGTSVTGKSVNVGFGGLSVTSAQSISPGTKCTVSIELVDDLTIEAKGVVVRSADGSTVIEFSAIRERDLEHLDALVRYNSEDADALVEDEYDESRPILDIY